MALKDRIPFGMSLPHRSPDGIDMDAVRAVAQRAEAYGFRDLWVTENTLDHVTCFDPVVILTYAAAVTRTIRLGASVLVLPVHDPRMVAHQWASLDQVSNGRAIMGVGLGRPRHLQEFQVPEAGRVARFREAIDLIRGLWRAAPVTHHGRFFTLDNAALGMRPVQQPVPIWMGGGHPEAIRRSASIADGWMGAGGSSTEDFRHAVPLLKAALAQAGRDPEDFPISKRIFIAVDENPAAARADLLRWYTEVYHSPDDIDTSGIHGTPEQVRARLEEIIGMGANHLLLNPVCRHVEQLAALAEVVGYPSIQTQRPG
ncbi:LLM class flavin-dependent oxidoreductase [Rhodopila sp.]|uniref:LLM class flavin-dependent oxidoreductase n=1 Tax=Rhodopila sp. TaxID=2480087 RepID=UPI003D10B3DE